ncbi:MAG TPA: hypothetical protein VGM56_19975 [Byssovorax sp.]|jgi:hypothetical protein
MLPRFFVSSIGLVLACAFARAAGAETPPREPRVDVGIRGGFVSASSVGEPAGALAYAEVNAHLAPWLRVGVYVAHTHAESMSSDGSAEFGQIFDVWRVGAKGELHARPHGVVDPWAGVGAGAFIDEHYPEPRPHGGDGLDLSLDVGVDFHIGRVVTLGVVYMLVVPATNAAAYSSHGFGGGTYYTGVLDVPVPALRLDVAF